MDLRKLKTLIDLVSDSKVSELEITEAEGKVRILDQKIGLHSIRAPIAGRIGHMVNLRAGAMLAERDRLCTIVPTGGLRAVDFFDPATAAGRVRAGIDAMAFAEVLTSALMGGLLRRSSGLSGLDSDGWIRATVEIFVRGIESQPPGGNA